MTPQHLLHRLRCLRSCVAALLFGPSFAGMAAQQPKPKRSSGGKGSAFTHAGTASGGRAAKDGGSVGRSKDGSAVPANPVESRSSHDRLRDSESPCNNAEAPHKVREGDVDLGICSKRHSADLASRCCLIE